MKIRILTLILAILALLSTASFAAREKSPEAAEAELAGDAVAQLTSLPALHIELENGRNRLQIPRNATIPARFTMVDGENTGEAVTNLKGEIRGRGNSTWTLPKKPYHFKLASASDLLGMGEAKTWVLLANYWDKTMLRNAVTYDLAQRINNIYAPEFRFVDLFINGSYQGIYMLVEKVEFDDERINCDPDKGAVRFEVEMLYRHQSEGCANCIITKSDTHIMLKDPEEGNSYTAAEMKEIKARALERLNEIEAELAKGYDAYCDDIDMRSFIDWFIANALAKNYDAAFVTSTYCYLDEEGILHMGPVWDVDVCFGNQDVTYPDTVDNGLNYYNYRSDKGAWYRSLFKDETFVAALKERWNTLMEDGSIDMMFDKIDEYAAVIEEARRYEEDEWPDALEVTHVRGKATPYFDWESEVAYFKEWLALRIDWLDSQWNDDYAPLDELTEVAKVTGADIGGKRRYSSVNGDVWKWRYTATKQPNRKVFASVSFMSDTVEEGEYVCSVAFKPGSNRKVTDYMMLRLVGVDEKGYTTTLLETPATHVTYATSVKDEEGYGYLNLTFDTSAYDYADYRFIVDAYNATVSIRDVTLYKK